MLVSERGRWCCGDVRAGFSGGGWGRRGVFSRDEGGFAIYVGLIGGKSMERKRAFDEFAPAGISWRGSGK